MKKSLVIGICMVLFLSCIGGVMALAEVGVVTPYTECASIDELRAAFPDTQLSDAPQGATQVSYANYTTGDPRPFAQIMFILEGHEYIYRAMAAEDRKAADKQEDKLSGLYIDFDEDVDEEDVREGDKIPFAVPAAFAFEFEIEYNRNDGASTMEWYIPEAKTQYNLFSQTAGMPDMKLLAVAELMLAKPQ